jgi:hypothetical protein
MKLRLPAASFLASLTGASSPRLCRTLFPNAKKPAARAGLLFLRLSFGTPAALFLLLNPFSGSPRSL